MNKDKNCHATLPLPDYFMHQKVSIFLACVPLNTKEYKNHQLLRVFNAINADKPLWGRQGRLTSLRRSPPYGIMTVDGHHKPMQLDAKHVRRLLHADSKFNNLQTYIIYEISKLTFDLLDILIFRQSFL